MADEFLNNTMASDQQPTQSVTMEGQEKSKKMKRWIIVAIIILLLLGNILLGSIYYFSRLQTQKISVRDNANANIVAFDRLFVDKVLRTQGVTSDQDRLALENAAHKTNDSDIISAWEFFLQSPTERDAQLRVLTLLDLFAQKIIY